MSKRFADTEIWRKKWYCELSPAMKTFWRYICDNCDNAGVWEVNIPLAEFQIGCKLSESDILSDFSGNIAKISDNKMLVIDFIRFQYGELKRECIPHRAVYNLIDKHGIPYPYPIDRVLYTLLDKDKDKDKEKDGMHLVNNNTLTSKEGDIQRGDIPAWRTDLAAYLADEQAAYDSLRRDTAFLAERRRFHPDLDLLKTLEKAHIDFWATEAGWTHKKRSRSKNLDWRATYRTALTMRSNQVWLPRQTPAERAAEAKAEARATRREIEREQERARAQVRSGTGPEKLGDILGGINAVNR